MNVNQMEVLKHNLKTQNEHGSALIKVIERVEDIESNVNEKYAEVQEVVNEVRDRVTIDHEDQKQLQSIVGKKSYRLANNYYGDGYGAEIRELAGYAIRHHWKLLKKELSVTRYTSIRHVDKDKAKDFVANIELDNVLLAKYEVWKLERAKKSARETELLKGDKGSRKE